MSNPAYRFISCLVVVVVVISLFFGLATPAFAEGEVPEDAPPVAAPEAGDSDPETLEQALSDGSAAVADAGALVPLASQSDLEASCVPDPWFYGTGCVGGVCRGLLPGEDGFVTIQEALDVWKDKNGVGYIYLEGSYAEDETLSITDAVKYSTLKGIVWDGLSGTPHLDGNLTVNNLVNGFLLQGFSINGEVTFSNTKGPIKLQKMTLNQVDHDGYSLRIINHTGAVTLDQVRVENALNTGVYVNNISPTGGATGTVSITGLTILNTTEDPGVPSLWNGGLYVGSKSPVTINGFFIKNVAGEGVLIEHGLGAVTVKNGYVSKSAGSGLRILGGTVLAGSVTLDNLRLQENNVESLQIEAAGTVKINNVVSYLTSGDYGLHVGDAVFGQAAKSVTITNSTFNGTGIVYISGPVSISNSSFWFGTGSGLDIDNTWLVGAPVTLKGVTSAENSGYGIRIVSRGNVALTDVTASNNYDTGALIDLTGGNGTVTILKSWFNDNGWDEEFADGLVVRSLKNINLGGVEASYNDHSGAILDNSLGNGSVTLLGIGINSFYRNLTGSGLEITTNGSVTITGMVAGYNDQYGVKIDNTGGLGGVSFLVTGLSSNSYNYFYQNLNQSGLEISTNGNVILTTVYADNNGSYGAKIDTTGGTGGVSIMASINRGNSFSDNSASGLHIRTRGNIILTSVDGQGNGGHGADLDNCLEGVDGRCKGIGSVTLLSRNSNSYVSFSFNAGSGLKIDTLGNITLNNLFFVGNGEDGLTLNNDNVSTSGVQSAGNITINFTERFYRGLNSGYGIKANSFGKIALKGVKLENNLHGGAYLYNLDSITPKDVVISDSEFSYSTNGKGLEIYTQGKVTLTSVQTYRNDVVEGVIALGEPVHEKISTYASTLEDTWKFTETRASATLAGSLNSAYNLPVLLVLDVSDGGSVVYESSADLGYPQDHTFSFNTIQGHEYEFVINMIDEYGGPYTFELFEFIDENSDGIADYYGHPESVSGLGGTGIYIDNSLGTAGVTIVSPSIQPSYMSNNSADGLFVKTNGPVLVNNFYSYGNSGSGVNITSNATSNAVPATVTLSNLNTSNNWQLGVRVLTLGNIVYSSSTSSNNYVKQAYLDNCRSDGAWGCQAAIMKPVTLSKLVIQNSDEMTEAVGLEVRSFGNITAGGITATGNTIGLSLHNSYLGSTGSITLLGSMGQNTFRGNTDKGVYILSNGLATLSNFLAGNNGNYGVKIQARGKITLSGGWIEENYGDGIYIGSFSGVSMSNMMVMNNSANGINISALDVSPVTITNSMIFGNVDNGIHLSGYKDYVKWPVLTGTIVFGNNPTWGIDISASLFGY